MPKIATGQQQIFYRKYDSGPTDGRRPPLILIHGAGGTLMNWPPQLRRLPATTVYALDLPGHGKSEGAGLTSISAYAEAVLGFAESLGLADFVAVGHSMGSAIAIEMALHRPAQLTGLVLIGAGADLSVAPSLLAGLNERYNETSAWLVKRMFGPSASPMLSAAYLEYLSALDRDLVRRDFAACNAFDQSRQIQQIHKPTLIVCGVDDKMTPPGASRFLHEQIAGSQLSLIEQAGHMVMLEQPQAVASSINTFLGGLP